MIMWIELIKINIRNAELNKIEERVIDYKSDEYRHEKGLNEFPNRPRNKRTQWSAWETKLNPQSDNSMINNIFLITR